MSNVSDLDGILSAAVKHSGKEVQLGGHAITIAPISLGVMKRFAPFISSLAKLDKKATSANGMQLLVDAIPFVHAVLQRNYPALTLEHVEELVDMTNFPLIFTAIMEASGIEQQNPESATGEKKATTEQSQ